MAPTFATALLSSRDLVFLLRYHRPNATRTQVFAVDFRTISSIGHNFVWTGTRTTTAGLWHSHVSQDLRQDHPDMALPDSDHHRQRPTLSADGMVDLRRQPTTPATDAVPGRLTLWTGKILVIRCGPALSARGMIRTRPEADTRFGSSKAADVAAQARETLIYEVLLDRVGSVDDASSISPDHRGNRSIGMPPQAQHHRWAQEKSNSDTPASSAMVQVIPLRTFVNRLHMSSAAIRAAGDRVM